MSNMYTAAMVDQTVIADSEMVIIRAATALASRASMLRLYRIACSQRGTSISQQLGVRWGLKASAFGTYTACTPAPMILGSVASAIAGSTSNAASSAGTDASANGAGTLTVLDAAGFNNLSGFEKIWVPEERPIVGIDTTFVLQLQGTPTTLTNWYASIVFEEMT